MADDDKTDETPETIVPKNFLKNTGQFARDEGEQKPKSFTVQRVQEERIVEKRSGDKKEG